QPMFANLFKTKNSEKLFEKGIEYYRDKKVNRAIDILTDAIKLENKNADPNKLLLSNIHCLRGEVYLSVGVAVLSQSDFNFALQHNPENESALNNLAIWHSVEKFAVPDYKKALQYFDKAIALQPDRKDIQLNRACIKIQSGDKSGCDDLRRLQSEGFANAKLAIERFCKI
ncbi:MAG: hypothetical protein C5B52_16185, partial [Bacteroidetes bacterium]